MVTVSSVAATEQHDNTITVTATKRIQSSFDVIGNVNVQTDEQLKKSLVNQTDDLSAVFLSCYLQTEVRVFITI